MTGRPPFDHKNANTNPEIVLFLSDDKMGRSVYIATKDHVHTVVGIDFLLHRNRYLNLIRRPFEAIPL